MRKEKFKTGTQHHELRKPPGHAAGLAAALLVILATTGCDNQKAIEDAEIRQPQ